MHMDHENPSFPEPSKLLRSYYDLEPWQQTRIHKAPPRPWLSLLKSIDDEVTALLRHQATWESFRKAVVNSKVATANPYFPMWVSELYSATVAIGIRRMVDDDDRTGSLVQLLQKMQAAPEKLTREWFIGGVELPLAQDLDQTFTIYGDPRQTGFFDPAVAREDLEKLRAISGRVRKYVNQHVAHAQRTRSADIPTYGDVHAVLDHLLELVHKYTLLLRHSDRVQGAPIIQEPWMRIFTQAWIQPEELAGMDEGTGS
jgi:hypothetical protein